MWLVHSGNRDNRMFCVSLISAFFIGASGVDAFNGFMKTPELVKKQKYPFETHQVVTPDNYILTHHRIPFGKSGPSGGTRGNCTRLPVLIQHGLVGDSSAWVNHDSKQVDSLGFLLADMGYDVWLLNTRGNYYSRGHTTKGRFDLTYFDFSYHEMGIYDLPATIDYVLAKTKVQQVYHIGHSQGTTAMWVMLSERPEYNAKVALHIAYAPVAFHTHSRNPVFKVFSLLDLTGVPSLMPFRMLEVPKNALTTIFLVSACSNWSPFRFICEFMYYWMMGFNSIELDRSELANIYGHYPSSSSFKQFTHFSQGLNRPFFAQFDYKHGNKNKYNSKLPPNYNLTRVQIPVYSFYGGVDAFCQLPDVQRLHSLLPNLKAEYYIEKWAHYDFLHGISARQKIYEPTIEILNQNSKRCDV